MRKNTPDGKIRQPVMIEFLTAIVCMNLWMTSARAADCVTWTPITPKYAPSPRFGHGMVYDSARKVTVVFGGTVDASSTFSSETWEWSSENQAWTQIDTIHSPSARSSFSMTYDAARAVVVLFGGFVGQNPNVTVDGETWEYDGRDWSNVTPAPPFISPAPRGLHNAAYDSVRKRTVLFGGTTQSGAMQTWEWDGSTWVLRTSSGATGRWGHAMAFDPVRNRTVLHGGYLFSGSEDGNTWEFDGAAGTWQLRHVGNSDAYHKMAFDSRRGVVVRWRLPSGYRMWNGATWTTIAADPGNPAPEGRDSYGMTFDENQGVNLMFGGSTTAPHGDMWQAKMPSLLILQHPTSIGLDFGATAHLDVDASANGAISYQWRRAGVALNADARIEGANSPHLTIANVQATDTQVYDVVMTSGCQTETSPQVAITLATCAEWRQRHPTNSPPASWGAAMAFDSWRNVMVLFGGAHDGAAVSPSTWEWDGVYWSERLVPGPSPRAGASMAFDSTRGVIVLFGGAPTQLPGAGETWEWNGTAWTLRATTGPPARQQAGMCFDARRNRVVLSGGSSGPALHDTWEWDGVSWEQRSPLEPSVHVSPIVYDQARGVCTLMQDSEDPNLREVWEWDGEEWNTLITSGPAARTWHGSAYHSDRARTLVFGGALGPGGGEQDQLWQWDAQQWALLSAGTIPRRSLHAMAYDSHRGVIVVFGGFTNNMDQVLNDTWEWGHAQADVAPSSGGNGLIDIDDLLMIIAHWGWTGTPAINVADIAPPGGDGVVDIDDLLEVIGAWGPCP